MHWLDAATLPTEILNNGRLSKGKKRGGERWKDEEKPWDELLHTIPFR